MRTNDTPDERQESPDRDDAAEQEVNRGKTVVLLVGLLLIVGVLTYGFGKLVSEEIFDALLLAFQIVTLLFVVAIYEKT